MSDDGPQNDNREPVTHKKHIAVTATGRPWLGMKHRVPGKRKPVAEYIFGYELFRLARKWVYKKRVIDRRNDRYTEDVTDPETGEVIHHCDEPLTEHRGDGPAKSKK